MGFSALSGLPYQRGTGCRGGHGGECSLYAMHSSVWDILVSTFKSSRLGFGQGVWG